MRKKINDKQYYTFAAIAFSVIAIGHAARIAWDLEAQLAGYSIPLWMSGVVVVIASYLAYRGFHNAATKQRHFCLW